MRNGGKVLKKKKKYHCTIAGGYIKTVMLATHTTTGRTQTALDAFSVKC